MLLNHLQFLDYSDGSIGTPAEGAAVLPEDLRASHDATVFEISVTLGGAANLWLVDEFGRTHYLKEGGDLNAHCAYVFFFTPGRKVTYNLRLSAAVPVKSLVITEFYRSRS